MRPFLYLGILFVLLGLLGMRMSAHADASPDESLRPIADVSCQIAASERARRIRIVEGHLIGIDAAEKEDQLQLGILNDDLATLNDSYAWSRLATAVSASASLVTASVFSTEVLVLGKIESVLGMTGPLMKSAVSGYIGFRAISAGSSVYLVFKDSAEHVQGDPAITDDLVHIHATELSVDGARFLNDPSWNGTQSPEDPAIVQAWEKVVVWSGKKTAESRDSDWNLLLGLDEWLSHRDGKRLADVEIPSMRVALVLLKMSREYHSRLLAVLENDAQACGSATTPNAS